MIEVMFFAPCDWNRTVIGAGCAEIAYRGEDPVKTATRYVRQNFGPRASVGVVVKDGFIWKDS